MSYNIAPIIDFNLLLNQTTECSFFLKNKIKKKIILKVVVICDEKREQNLST